MGVIFLFSSRVRALSSVFIEEKGWEGEERDQAHQVHQAPGGMGQYLQCEPEKGACTHRLTCFWCAFRFASREGACGRPSASIPMDRFASDRIFEAGLNPISVPFQSVPLL
jgi:hypothetical protein